LERPAVTSGHLAQAARSPGQAAPRAPCAGRADNEPATEPAATEPATATAAAATSAAAAPSAANKSAAAATPEAAAPAAAATVAPTATVAAAATATATAGHLHAAADVFPVEQMERGETDVGHFLFTKNETLIGRGIVGLRDISSGRRGRGCAADQRKTQSGGAQHLHGGGFGCAFLLRSLLDPSHGRILRKFL
jgi:hypothetical protein